MKHQLKRIFSVIVCIIMLFGILPAGIAAETEKTVTTYSLPLYLSPVSSVKAGDINGDSKVNNKDLTRLFQYLSKWDVAVNSGVLDVNGDGKVNNKDLTRLFQYLSNWDVKIFPECQHSGGTEIRGVKEPTCTESGYTGDTCCIDCGSVLVSGTYIQPTGHLHTEVRGAYPATCTGQGYTGDTYCTDCGAKTATGSYTPAAGHHGGTATYYEKAVCEECQAEYGDYSQIWAYDSLNDNQKGMYDILDDAINRLERGTVYVTDYADNALTGESDLNVAIRALSYDRPEYFWMPKSYNVGKAVNKSTGKLVELYVSFSSDSDPQRGQYHVTDTERAQMQAELETKVSEIVALTNAYETVFEKEIFLHDYLCKNIVYDSEAAESETPDFKAFTSYGALILETCVCEGYSRAMQIICQRIGIPCNLVTGTYWRFDDKGQLYGTPHMWNIINPGDGCYYLDVTFNDLGYDAFPLWHNCFNITKAELEIDHDFDDPFSLNSNYSDPYAEYNFFDTHGDNYSLGYYTKTGAYIDFVEDENDYHDAASAAAGYLAQAKQKGYTYVDLLFDYDYCIKYEPTEEKPEMAAEVAVKLLNRQLREAGMNTVTRYVFLNNYLYIPVP